MKSWLGKNAIEIYSTHNEGKSFVAERFIRNLVNKKITNTSLHFQKNVVLKNDAIKKDVYNPKIKILIIK